MSIKGKERAALRSEAHHLDVKVHIGHQGLSPALLSALDDVLRTHELVKVQVSKAGNLTAKAAANAIAEQLGVEVVQVIGRTCTVFRENPDLKRGELPPWRQ